MGRRGRLRGLTEAAFLLGCFLVIVMTMVCIDAVWAAVAHGQRIHGGDALRWLAVALVGVGLTVPRMRQRD